VPVSHPRRPFGAREVTIEGPSSPFRLTLRVNVQHDPRHLAPSMRLKCKKTNSSISRRGMAVTVEIKTGTRRIINYLMSPLHRYRQESLRER
jgi:hypothetical protein